MNLNLFDPVAMGKTPAPKLPTPTDRPTVAPPSLPPRPQTLNEALQQAQSAVTLYDRPFRVAVFGNSPYLATGYGTQTALFVTACKKWGIEVCVFCMAGEEGTGKMYPTRYGPVPVYPRNRNRHDEFSQRTISRWAHHFEADIVIHFIDADILDCNLYPDVRIVAQYPVDCEPIAPRCLPGLRQAWARITYSEHGYAWTKAEGLESYYIPHGIDTSVFTPGDKLEARRHAGLPEDRFIVGVVAGNFDSMPTRKGWDILFEAFAGFKQTEEGKDALLYLHTMLHGGVSLPWLMKEYGLKAGDDVLWCDQDQVELGIPTSEMVALYRSFDVMALASRGEGFGLPLLEAQACGCPVICGDWTAMEQLCFAGIHIPKGEGVGPNGENLTFSTRMRGGRGSYQYHMNPVALCGAFQQFVQARDAWPELAITARQGALAYDFDRLFEHRWIPVLNDLAQRIEKEDEPKLHPRPARENPEAYNAEIVPKMAAASPQVIVVSPSHREKCGINEYNLSCHKELSLAGYRTGIVERVDAALEIARQCDDLQLVLIQHEYSFWDNRSPLLGRGESTLHLISHLKALCETNAKVGLLLHTVSPRRSEYAVNGVLAKAIELGLPIYATSFEGANFLGCKWLPLGTWEEGDREMIGPRAGTLYNHAFHAARSNPADPLIIGNFGMLGNQRKIDAHVELCRATGSRYLGSHYCQTLHHKEALQKFFLDNQDIEYVHLWTDYCDNDELLRRLQMADVLYMPRNDIDLYHVSASVVTAMSANRPIIVNRTQCYSDMESALLFADTVEEAAIIVQQLKDPDFYAQAVRNIWEYMEARNIVNVWEEEFGIKAGVPGLAEAH